MAPDWIAGVSISGINAALIAGNPPERRAARLSEFWEGYRRTALSCPRFEHAGAGSGMPGLRPGHRKFAATAQTLIPYFLHS
ncbi:hypothetical protein [Paraburkholderia sediminicola]|uniref:hypothetical protein n=1 Tax=Paraburkholderia sediminicola TaxID=458836 RepID=UPI0038B78DD1